MSNINNIDPIDLGIISSAMAIALAKGNSASFNNVLGNLLVSVGGIILTIAAQQSAQEPEK